LEVALYSENITHEFIEQALDYFPPTDETEVVPMSNTIISLLEKENRIAQRGVLKAMTGFVKILTSREYQMRKYGLPDDLISRMTDLLKTFLSNNPGLLGTMEDSISYSQARTQKLHAILE